MKKILALMLCIILAVSMVALVACDNDDTPESTAQSTSNSTASSTPAGTADSTPNSTAGSTPDSKPAEAPGSTPASVPGGTPDSTPASVPGGTVSSTPSSVPGGTVSSTPASVPGGTPDSTPSSVPGGTPDSTPDSKPSQIEDLNGKTPEELYAAALESVKGLTNYEMTTTQVITMTYQGMSIPMTQVVVSKMDGQNIYLETTNDFESSQNMTAWYVDEWFYVIQENVNAKANITYQEMQEKYMPEGATSDGALMNIPENWFKDIKFMKDGDKYYIELVVSGEEYLEYMQSTALGNQLQGVDDVIYRVYFDANGNLGDVVTEFAFAMDGGIDCYAVSTATIENIGTTVIEAPSGEFIDVTDQMK